MAEQSDDGVWKWGRGSSFWPPVTSTVSPADAFIITKQITLSSTPDVSPAPNSNFEDKIRSHEKIIQFTAQLRCRPWPSRTIEAPRLSAGPSANVTWLDSVCLVKQPRLLVDFNTNQPMMTAGRGGEKWGGGGAKSTFTQLIGRLETEEWHAV